MSDQLRPASVPANEAGIGGPEEVDEGAWVRDLLCGSVFGVLGLAFAIGGSRYEIGSAVRMGPGYLPLVLGGALALLGFITLGQGVIAWRSHAVPAAPTSAASAAQGPARTESRTETGTETGTDTDTDTGTQEEGHATRSIPWARGALVIAAIVFFGFTIEGLGVIPTVFVTSLLAALAGQHTKLFRVLLTAVGITLVTWLIFVVLLQLRLPLFGDWIGG